MSKRRNGFRCFECDSKANHAHHVVPHVKGGTRTLPLCGECHGKVHDQDFTNHSELTKAGIVKARKEGRPHGRPKMDVDCNKVAKLRSKGLTWQEVGVKLGISFETLRKSCRVAS